MQKICDKINGLIGKVSVEPQFVAEILTQLPADYAQNEPHIYHCILRAQGLSEAGALDETVKKLLKEAVTIMEFHVLHDGILDGQEPAVTQEHIEYFRQSQWSDENPSKVEVIEHLEKMRDGVYLTKGGWLASDTDHLDRCKYNLRVIYWAAKLLAGSHTLGFIAQDFFTRHSVPLPEEENGEFAEEKLSADYDVRIHQIFYNMSATVNKIMSDVIITENKASVIFKARSLLEKFYKNVELLDKEARVPTQINHNIYHVTATFHHVLSTLKSAWDWYPIVRKVLGSFNKYVFETGKGFNIVLSKNSMLTNMNHFIGVYEKSLTTSLSNTSSFDAEQDMAELEAQAQREQEERVKRREDEERLLKEAQQQRAEKENRRIQKLEEEAKRADEARAKEREELLAKQQQALAAERAAEDERQRAEEERLKQIEQAQKEKSEAEQKAREAQREHEAKERQRAREALLAKAQANLGDHEDAAKYSEQLADIDSEFADAESKLQDRKAKLEDTNVAALAEFDGKENITQQELEESKDQPQDFAGVIQAFQAAMAKNRTAVIEEAKNQASVVNSVLSLVSTKKPADEQKVDLKAQAEQLHQSFIEGLKEVAENQLRLAVLSEKVELEKTLRATQREFLEQQQKIESLQLEHEETMLQRTTEHKKALVQARAEGVKALSDKVQAHQQKISEIIDEYDQKLSVQAEGHDVALDQLRDELTREHGRIVDALKAENHELHQKMTTLREEFSKTLTETIDSKEAEIKALEQKYLKQISEINAKHSKVFEEAQLAAAQKLEHVREENLQKIKEIREEHADELGRLREENAVLKEENNILKDYEDEHKAQEAEPKERYGWFEITAFKILEFLRPIIEFFTKCFAFFKRAEDEELLKKPKTTLQDTDKSDVDSIPSEGSAKSTSGHTGEKRNLPRSSSQVELLSAMGGAGSEDDAEDDYYSPSPGLVKSSTTSPTGGEVLLLEDEESFSQSSISIQG